MGLKQQVRLRAIAVAVRYQRWRGDPLARLMGPGTVADPYPLYAEVRARGLHRSPIGIWLAADHGTVAAVLRDGRFSSAPEHWKGYEPPRYPPGDPRAEFTGVDTSLLSMDPPDHTRIRRLVSSAFTPRAVAALEPMIRATTDRLLADVDRSNGFDLIDALAFPLPLAVICHLLGVPAGDRDRLRTWGHAAAATLEPQLAEPPADVVASMAALGRYLRDLIEKRRGEPDGSLLSALIAAEEEGDRLTSDELVATALLLLVAGFETTVNLIGNGVAALMGTPDQWVRLRADASRIPAAVEELLRYDSPVQMTSRIATTDLDLAGQTIPQGTPVIVLTGGANRDPAVFDEPDRLDIGRTEAGKHLSFSLGIHHCLGAALARLEGRVVFEELTQRFGRLTPAGPAQRRPFLVLRGYECLPVLVA